MRVLVSLPKIMQQTQRENQSKIETKLDLDLIVERLQADGVLNCDRIPPQAIKQALIHWFDSIVESMNEEPEWWIRNHCTKQFKSHLPEPLDNDPDFQDESELKEFATL